MKQAVDYNTLRAGPGRNPIFITLQCVPDYVVRFGQFAAYEESCPPRWSVCYFLIEEP